MLLFSHSGTGIAPWTDHGQGWESLILMHSV